MMFNWNDILFTVITAAVVPALIAGVKYLIAYLSAKTQSTKLQHALQVAGDTIQSVVAETSQTFVDDLKGTPDWNTDAMKRAFDQSAEKAKALIGSDMQQLIAGQTGDFDAWLTAKIEQAVNQAPKAPPEDPTSCSAIGFGTTD